MIPGVVVIAKQFEYGRKILNIVGKLKAKALNQIYDALAGNSRLRPALANYTDDVVKGVDDVVEINRKTVTKLYSVEEFKEKINKLPHPEISNYQFEKVLKTTKGNRPDPIYLYKQSDIDAHLKIF